jgi:nucleoside-diphosphate-sugar epimerase
MNVLVIGGSYFFGRVFTLFANDREDMNLFVLNRGNYPFDMEGITEYHADRHDTQALSTLPPIDYDVVIDFCGYNEGDIRTIFEHLCGSFRQYIFISTVDVYKRGTGTLKGEATPYEDIHFGGDTGEYIHQKILLEKELISCCGEKGCAYTIVRPSILYGPYNYAPRESVYIEHIVKGNVLPCPYDADGRFQMIYVKDAALMTIALCGNEKAYNEAFNLCPDEIANYDLFFAALKTASDLPVNINSISVRDAADLNIFLPFPATSDETELYDGSKVTAVTGLSYTPLSEGLARTYAAFKNVFQN